MLTAAKVPILQSDIDPHKMNCRIDMKFRSFNAHLTVLHETTKRSFVAYCKFVYLQKNNKVFNAEKLDLVGFTKSLGFITVQRLWFLKNSNISIPSLGNILLENYKETLIGSESDDLQLSWQSMNHIEDPLVRKNPNQSEQFLNVRNLNLKILHVWTIPLRKKSTTAAKRAKILKRKIFKVHDRLNMIAMKITNLHESLRNQKF